jgi:hypothetical protein
MKKKYWCAAGTTIIFLIYCCYCINRQRGCRKKMKLSPPPYGPGFFDCCVGNCGVLGVISLIASIVNHYNKK